MACHRSRLGCTLGRLVISAGFQAMRGSHLHAVEGGSAVVQMLTVSCSSNTRLDPALRKALLEFSEIFALPPMPKGASNRA